MSNWRAIAAVTYTLRSLLTEGFDAEDFGLPDAGTTKVDVISQPPDQVQAQDAANYLNVFLYQTMPNAAWRNADLPQRTRSGEVGQPPLALDLYYLLTSYSQGNDSSYPISHFILGRAMSILHDHPVLNRNKIEEALPQSLLHEQIERIRITPYPLSLDELSKLWNTFQTGYRISAAYQATVVLIESNRPTRAALPVLRRNTDADEMPVLAEIPSYPMLFAVRLTDRDKLSATSGDELTIQGRGLSGDTVQVRFTNPLREVSEVVVPNNISAPKLTVTLPEVIDSWPAGYSTVAVLVEKGGRTQGSNELPLALVPVITVSDIEFKAANEEEDRAKDMWKLTIAVTPPVLPRQRVALLFGDLEVSYKRDLPQHDQPEPSSPADSLSFNITDVTEGTYIVRLRVDGVDSIPYERSGDPLRLQFADSQKVMIAHE